MIGNDSDVGCIVLTSEQFGDNLWSVVGDTIKTLTKAGYQLKVYEDEVDIVVINFAYLDSEFTDIRLEWITDEEREYIDCLREEVCSCHGCCDCCDETNSESYSEDEYTQLDIFEAVGEIEE